MKRLCFILYCFLSFSASAQISCNFEDTSYRTLLSIDTVNYKNNAWQVGKPRKKIFDSAFSVYKYDTSRNAIVTDTLNPYPADDTSVFIIKVLAHPSKPLDQPFIYGLQFWYQLDIDSDAVASVEISVDGGLTWLNITKDTDHIFYWRAAEEKVNFDTSTHDWKLFTVTFPPLHNALKADTTLLRFTFLSKKNDSLKDGWMIDDISIVYYEEGAATQINKPLQIQVYPNPVIDLLTIVSPDIITSISISNMLGQVIYSHEYDTKSMQIDISGYPPGMYFLKVNDSYVTKFVKQ